MKTLLKIFLVIIVFIVFVVKCTNESNHSEKEKNAEIFWEKNPGMKDKKFQELTLAEKEIFLNQFIEGEFEPFSTWGAKVELGLKGVVKGYVKYPETIKYRFLSNWGDYAGFVSGSTIENVEKGVLVTSGEFKSENKLGMEVRSSYTIRYKIEGDSFVVMDLNID